jgi:hypothetical protein
MEGFFYRMSGWNKLLERFPAEKEPEGNRFSGKTIAVGAVRYRRCVTVSASQQGLYLTAKVPLTSGNPPILIPWCEIKKVQKSWEPYIGECIMFSIGEPEIGIIKLPMDVFNSTRPYLEPKIVQIT